MEHKKLVLNLDGINICSMDIDLKSFELLLISLDILCETGGIKNLRAEITKDQANEYFKKMEEKDGINSFSA